MFAKILTGGFFMSKNRFVIAGIFLSLILFTGCDNATNNINRAANYNPNVTSENKNGSTFDFIGRFFNNWEDGKVTNDRYKNYDSSQISEPMDDVL